MGPLYFVTRNLQSRLAVFKANRRIFQAAKLCSSSDDEKRQQDKLNEKKKSEDALHKLNNLLKTMIEEETTASKESLNLAKPSNKRKKSAKVEDNSKPVTAESPEKQMMKAVKNVAESIGGDPKQTESELLMKLLNSSDEDKGVTSLSDLVKGMKIDHDDKSNKLSRAQQVRQILHHVEQTKTSDTKIIPRRPRLRTSRPRSELPVEKIDLFGSEPLGIFTDAQATATEGVENKTWTMLYERDLKLAVTHPPSNYFQQMILWTEQGKVWKFPIDNEQGLEEEQKVYFAEHVFLEKHLEPWCPQKGPIRHFMELVCVGLSKNPYLTVEAKKEHIEWFKNYFEDKKQLLKEVGALQDPTLGSVSTPKQIE